MNNAAVRVVVRIVGVIAVLLGALWVGQGLNLLPGSAMSGVRTWFWVGAALVLVGLGLLFSTRRRPGRPRA